MNRVYKVIRNAEGAYIAVAETAKSAGKTKSVALVAAAIISAVSFSAQANTMGIQTGVNDVAIGSQATSTGKNNIAIGEGSFAAGGTLTEAEAKQLIINSQAKINQISNTQLTIAEKEKAVAQYLATVEKVERNQAEIERLTGLNNTEKGKTGGLTSEFNTANGIYIAKQAEVDTKVSYLEKLDLNKYGALNESSLDAIATDVKNYVEQGDATNSLGDQFYKNYVSAYVEKVARLDYTYSLSKAAITNESIYVEKTQSTVRTKDLFGKAAQYNINPILPEQIPTTTIAALEETIRQNNLNRTAFNNNKDKIIDDILAANSQLKGMYENKRNEFIRTAEDFYNYKENEARLTILQKQTGIMTGNEPDYLAKVNETKRLKAEQEQIKANGGVYDKDGYNYLLGLYKWNIAEFISSLAQKDGQIYVADKIATIRDADTNQAAELKTFLTNQIASVKKRSDDAQTALASNQSIIANYEKNIANRQPTPEELLAYQKAKAEEAALIAQRDKLKKETDELKVIQASLEEGKDAVAMGANSKAIGDGAVALGANNDVLAANGIALGTSNSVTGTGSIAIGAGNTVSGTNSIAVGTGHKVTGSNSGAFGDPSEVSGDGSYAYGNNSNISGSNSHAIGNSNLVNSNNSFILGNDVNLTAAATGSIIVGSGASSTVANGIAIGNNSVVNRIDSVSVGSSGAERQIINVKSGTSNTDAVNFGQLTRGLAGKADITYVDNAISNIPTVDISGKADKTYVDQQDKAQNVIIDNKANQTDLKTTNQTVADNKASQVIKDQQQDELIASNKTDSDSKNTITNGRIDAVSTTVADNKTAQGLVDTAQDAVIAGKLDKSDFEADQKRQDDIIAQNKAEQADIDANQNNLIVSNTQTITANKAAADKNNTDTNIRIDETSATVAQNKTDQAAIDAAQNVIIDNKANQTDLKTTNQTVADNKASQVIKDQQQDELIASNKTDSDSKNTITNGRIDAVSTTVADNKTAQGLVDTAQDAITVANKVEADKNNTDTNIRIDNIDTTIEQNNTAVNNSIKETNITVAANKAEADAKDAATNVRVDNTNTTVAQNKADQALTDAAQDAITATNKAEADAKDAATNERVDKTNTTVAQNKADQALTDAAQDAITAANKDIAAAADAATNVRIDDIDVTIAGNNTTINNRIDKTDAVIAQNKNDQAVVDATQDIAIAGKVDVTDFVADQKRQDAASKAESERLDAANNVINNTIANNKIEQAGVDTTQDIAIAGKVDVTDFVADQKRQDAASKAESERLDAVNATINQTIVSNKTDITLKVDTAVGDLSAKNDVQDALIVKNTQTITANKAEQVSRDSAQDVVIAGKVDVTDFVADQKRQDAALKAESGRLDAVNNVQDGLIATNSKNITINTDDIINLKKVDAALGVQITTNNTTINDRVDKVVTAQKGVDIEQDRLIALNANRFDGLSDRVNSLDKTLSSGISSAMALSAMPTMSQPGAHMITGGSGYFNGAGSVAIGATGTTDDGKYSYKIGGTYTKDGGSGFSMGGGYRWK